MSTASAVVHMISNAPQVSSSSYTSSSSSRRGGGYGCNHMFCARRPGAGPFAVVLLLCCATGTFYYSLSRSSVAFHPAVLLGAGFQTTTPQQKLLYNNNNSSIIISSIVSRITRTEDNGGQEGGGGNHDDELMDDETSTMAAAAPSLDRTSTSTSATSPFRFIICTRIKNEAPYLREWIEYHRMIGFESFYLLNNDSTDATQCILDAYIKRGIVMQMNPENSSDDDNVNNKFEENLVFDKCVDRLMWERDNNKTRRDDDLSNTWMATHDVDEFIWFQDTTTTSAPADSTTTALSSSSSSFSPTLLQTAVHNLQQRHPSMQSMFIPRFLFGSTGYNHFQPGLVIKRYTHRFDPTGCQQQQQQQQPQQAADGDSDNDNTTHQQLDQRRLTIAFDKSNGGPTSFCNPSQNVTTAYRGAGKGMTLVNVLARDCRSPNQPTQKLPFCHGTHFHKLRNVSHPTGMVFVRDEDWERHPTTLGDARYVGDAAIVHDIAIVHYMTRSREEFFQRTCGSRWIEKYQRCPTCSPETYFNLSETYTNNFVDERMAPFAQRLESILSDDSSSLVNISQCKTAPPETKPWTFYRNCWQRKKRSGKKTKVVVDK